MFIAGDMRATAEKVCLNPATPPFGETGARSKGKPTHTHHPHLPHSPSHNHPTGRAHLRCGRWHPQGGSCGKLCPFWSSCRKAVTLWRVRPCYSLEVGSEIEDLATTARGSVCASETLNHEIATDLQPPADTSNKLLRHRHARCESRPL